MEAEPKTYSASINDQAECGEALHTRPRDNLPFVELIQAAGLKPVAIRWIFPGYLARGKFHVLAGAPSTGKTTISMNLAACITAGLALPSGWIPEIGSALIWSGEDDPADTLVPRLIAAGADISKVHFVGDTREDGLRRPFDPARDIELLIDAAAKIDDLALIVVDPIVSAVSRDSHKNAEVRRGLAPLIDLAARTGAALLGITHYSKGTAGRDPLERVIGSIAFGALPRVVLGTMRMESKAGKPQRMVLARAKSNIGPDGGGFTYTFGQRELPNFPDVSASCIEWAEAVDGTARELLAEPEPDNLRKATALEQAKEWLRDLLNPGEIRTEEIKSEAEAAGLTWATVRRAKDAIGVQAIRRGFGGVGNWFWKLPDPVPGKGEQVLLHPKHISTFVPGERLLVTPKVETSRKDAQPFKDAKGAHLPRVDLGEPVSSMEVFDL